MWRAVNKAKRHRQRLDGIAAFSTFKKNTFMNNLQRTWDLVSSAATTVDELWSWYLVIEDIYVNGLESEALSGKLSDLGKNEWLSAKDDIDNAYGVLSGGKSIASGVFDSDGNIENLLVRTGLAEESEEDDGADIWEHLGVGDGVFELLGNDGVSDVGIASTIQETYISEKANNSLLVDEPTTDPGTSDFNPNDNEFKYTLYPSIKCKDALYDFLQSFLSINLGIIITDRHVIDEQNLTNINTVIYNGKKQIINNKNCVKLITNFHQ